MLNTVHTSLMIDPSLLARASAIARRQAMRTSRSAVLARALAIGLGVLEGPAIEIESASRR